jgi:hypothetical protein
MPRLGVRLPVPVFPLDVELDRAFLGARLGQSERIFTEAAENPILVEGV